MDDGDQPVVKEYSPKLLNWWELSPPIMIQTDHHCPHYNRELFLASLDIAKQKGIKKLLIGGDFFNFDAFSTFAKKQKSETIEDCLACGEELLGLMSGLFSEIYITMGNHDDRLIKIVEGQFSEKQIEDLINADRYNARVSYYQYAKVISGDFIVRVTHPGSYSRDAGKVPMRLADKFGEHIIGSHGHHRGFWAVGKSGRFGVDIGGMMDVRYLEYVMHKDTTHDKWSGGFAIIENGECILYDDEARPCISFNNTELWITPDELVRIKPYRLESRMRLWD